MFDNKKKKIQEKILLLHRTIVNYKVILQAIVWGIIAIALVCFGIYLRNNNIIGAFESISDKGDVNMPNSLFSELLIALGGALFSVASLSVVWELFIRRAWLEEMQENILLTLSKPEVANNLNNNWQLRTIKQLLCNLSGQQIGEMIHGEFQNKVFSTEKLRRNFIYNVTLCEGNNGFYDATFHLNYKAIFFSETFNVRLLINSNSMQIHDDYQVLLKRYENDIYRYILFNADSSKLPNDNSKILSVEKCIISCEGVTINYEIATVKKSNVDNSIYVELSLPSDKKEIFKDISGKECEITLRIKTLVDTDWCYFPMMFGYPVDNFSTRLDIVSSGKHEINIIGLFTSSGKFIRDESIHQEVIAAGGRLDDIILPDSGLVYVWKKCEER